MDRAAINEHINALLATGQQRGAVQAAIEFYGAEIRRFLVQRLGERDAPEAFSMFCEDLTRGIAGFRGDCPFDLWLLTLARNAATRWATRWNPPGVRGFETTEAQQLSDPRWDGRSPEPVRDPTKPWQRTSIKNEFEQLRQQLTEEEIALLTLRVAEELSWEEIARRWPDPGPEVQEVDGQRIKRLANTLKKRFERLKEKLRKLAEEVGLLDEGSTDGA
jgi:RNA polymerase sigma-70 factor, ECF subfamily